MKTHHPHGPEACGCSAKLEETRREMDGHLSALCVAVATLLGSAAATLAETRGTEPSGETAALLAEMEKAAEAGAARLNGMGLPANARGFGMTMRGIVHAVKYVSAGAKGRAPAA